MPDREKVIRGLECIGGYRHMEANPCAECGYNECQTFSICIGEVARDALELLKEQEPVVPKLSYSTCRCGKCENIVGLYLEGHFQYKDSFCGKCGREVNWREMRFDG